MPLLYTLEKPLGNIFMRIYYRLDAEGADTIPDKQALILAPNHVNAFVDPTLSGMILKPTVRFFARGDVFKGKLAKAVLNSLNISPMYRIQEGYSELKKNDKTFEECRQRLAKNEALLLFPEALCIQGRRLRPLKKGLARIAFQSAEAGNYQKEILVFPVGITYAEGKKFRSDAFIHYGKPLSVLAYAERYKTDRVRTINEFTRDLEAAMSGLLVHINNPENDRLVEGIEKMFLSEWIKVRKLGAENKVKTRYLASREIAQAVNMLEASVPEALPELRTSVVNYIRRLRGNGLRDHLLRPEVVEKMNIGTFLLEYLILFFCLPVYFVGLILNYPPYFLAREISDKKIKNVEFYASVNSTLWMLFYLLYYAINVITVGLVFRSWPLLIADIILTPLLGYFCVWFYPRMKKIFGRWRLLRMVRKDRIIIEELVTERSKILAQLSDLLAAYTKQNPAR
jgi:1-acyl-sn-glycerol-3-phosphate acyltransferase